MRVTKILKSFLIATAICGTVSAATYSKRTFLMPRPQGSNLAMEMSLYHDHIFNVDNKFKNDFQATPFYQAGIKGEDVGKYFGIGNGKNNFTIGNPATDNVDNRYFVHNGDAAHMDAPAGTMVFNPKQAVYGVRLDYFHSVNSNPGSKVFIKASAPFVHVSNDMHFKVLKATEDTNKNSIEEFFKGSTISTSMTSSQDALTKGKLGTRRSITGFANLDLHLGYKLVLNEKYHVFLNACVSLPTGNKPRAEYLFEPVYGNGGHVALGWGIDASARLWKTSKHSGRVLFALNHKYAFDGTEARTIPISSDLTAYPFSQYYLAAKKGQTKTSGLFPAANVLTQNVRVRPGNEVDAMAMLNFKTKRFLIDLGYSLYYKENEAISLKAWEDDLYGIVTTSYRPDGSHEFSLTSDADTLIKLNTSNLDPDAAGTPSQLTHKVFGGLGYNFNMAEYLTTLGIGASYEFAPSNNELEGYSFWGKFIISF